MWSCLCDMVSEVWMARASGAATAKMQIEMLLDQLSMRQARLELLHRECIADARRHKAAAQRKLFRERMLEHRRLQTQQLQLQRYRESALAQLDAVSNHEINQTFLRAMRSSGVGLKDARTAMDEMHETVSSVQEISALLGQPVGASLADEVIDDDELELDFAEQDVVAAPVLADVPRVVVAMSDEAPAVETQIQPLMLRTTVFGV